MSREDEAGPPRIHRIDVFLSQGADLIATIAGAIEGQDDGVTTAGREAVRAWGRLSRDVPNGGFAQFFFNNGGDRGVEAAADLLDELGAARIGPLLREAAAVYRRHEAEFQTENPWDGLFGSIQEFDRLDRNFMNAENRASRALAKWIRENIESLAVDERGMPLDPAFTGTVERKTDEGVLIESLEVRKGKPHGAHRRFFEDGSVRRVVFYKSGKATGDFWPDGTPRRKESKKGDLKIIEWFHRNGRIQKRWVQSKGGHAVEPIRVYHENGALAEELSVRDGKPMGPWLRFFDDGSPRLVAEYEEAGRLIVRDAWDDDRRRVVADGTGLYRDDGRGVNTAYRVFSQSDWPVESELKDGIPHGLVTRYHRGALWSRSRYENGVQHGESTLYWNNGRARSVTLYTNGVEGKTTRFPKFDRPVPAVIVKVEANRELYEAWGHAPVDTYPRALNLEEVQAEVVVPGFLREVEQRNRDGAIRSEYEDWNTFDDSIGYFLSVDESGEVVSADATGSGVYSGPEWDTYVPVLEKIRFEPGSIGGRAIPCRVMAWVAHTFVEGGAES